ncbi:MAG: matrixin family metalloprotease [Chloroflexota bacterium]
MQKKRTYLSFIPSFFTPLFVTCGLFIGSLSVWTGVQAQSSGEAPSGPLTSEGNYKILPISPPPEERTVLKAGMDEPESKLSSNGLLLSQTKDEEFSETVEDIGVQRLVDHSDLIGLARVLKIDSFWSADGSQIESVTTLQLSRQLKGDHEEGAQIMVYTIGGFLPQEDLGMMQAHEASFSYGEEVLIFAKSHKNGYRLVEGAAGKLVVTGKNFLDHFRAQNGSLTSLVGEIVALLHERNGGGALWRPTTAFSGSGFSPHFSTSAQQYFVMSGYRRWSTPNATVPFYVHVNTEQTGQNDGGQADFLLAICNAAKTWNRVSRANFSLQYQGTTSSTSTGYNGRNEVVFMDKGSGERGAVAQVWYRRDLTIVEADIWINDDYDWNVTGPLTPYELDLQSALLHEFGHWLVLGHLADREAAMYPKLSGGMVKRNLHQADEQGISTIYPCPSGNCRPD